MKPPRCGRCRLAGHNRATCSAQPLAWESQPTAHVRREPVERHIWRGMLWRCGMLGAAGQRNYAGRGIKVCERWLSYEAFFADMGPRPSGRHSIDRIDVNGHYEPGNCRWATPTEQARNKRTSLMIAGEASVAMAERRGTSRQLALYHYRTRDKRKRVFFCRACGLPGHNKRTCRAGIEPYVRGEFSEAS